MTIKTERSSHDRDTTNLHPLPKGNSPHLAEKFSREVGAISQPRKLQCMKNAYD